MCGRYALKIDENFPSRFSLHTSVDFTSRFNITPDSLLPTIVRNSPNSLKFMKWGLIPSWSKDGKSFCINARWETLETKHLFAQLLDHQRCLIPTTGYFEWKKIDKNTKLPYFITWKSEVYKSFAGIFSTWKNTVGDITYSFVIITIPATSPLDTIHDRIPVILSKKSEELWLTQDISFSDLKLKLKTIDRDEMLFFPVSKAVNDPSNDDSDLIKPLL